MTYLLIITAVAAVVALAIAVRDRYELKRKYRRFAEDIRRKSDDYVFLINPELKVQDSNYHALRPQMSDDGPHYLGNVLHCKNGCDSGLCGSSSLCTSCPVRYVIKNSFRDRRDFSNVEATMELYDEKHDVQSVDVTVSGELVYALSRPYMMVSVCCASSSRKGRRSRV